MSAKPQVTITLGRSGQVVKRSGATSEGFQSDYGTSSGGKRPMRERLRNSSDEYGGMPQNKRLRRENHQWHSDNDMNDDNLYQSNNHIGRNDLRFKLMRKKVPARQMNLGSKMHDVDLRERLSRTGQIPYRSNPRKHQPEAKSFGSSGRIPPTRSADDLLHVDSIPDRLLGSSRGLSPQRNYDDIRQRSSIRSLDSPRSTSAMEKRSTDVPKPAAFSSKAPYPAERPKAVMRPPSNGTMKTSYVIRILSERGRKKLVWWKKTKLILVTRSFLENIKVKFHRLNAECKPGEPTNVSNLLHSLGLGKYAIIFQAEEVIFLLYLMVHVVCGHGCIEANGDTDLKELGIPMKNHHSILFILMVFLFETPKKNKEKTCKSENFQKGGHLIPTQRTQLKQ
ncbi:unnamed protein product [Spirodela intermedia]|uniref:Uncharacterized protein n=1 Tax=Spirodela intermedia TaxID=51605 RepID=A0A7I8JIT9_SPIIN|nr:unnamed protein product [Spirodela intermedia]CAA6670049.1 unnamed protein product [Spirodela intermedia]